MTRNVLVVAALLLATLEGIAAAADNNSEHLSKNAQKVVVILDSLGINDPDIKEFISGMDAHAKDGYFSLAERNELGGKFSLRYQFDPGICPKHFGLTYTPDDSHIDVTARTNSVLVNYHLKF